MLYAEIDLAALRRNLERLRELINGAAFLFVVKADAYGHGLEEVARAAADIVDWFGVETVEEGITIRSLGIANPILVMVPPVGEDLGRAIRQGFHFVLGDRGLLREAERAAAAAGRPAFVHIPVDTGMGRYGFLPEEVEGLVRELSFCLNVEAVGIYSHFSSAHREDPADAAFTARQIEAFSQVVERLAARGISFPWVHIANSAGLLSFPETIEPPYNMVRVGAAAYGYVAPFWRRWGLEPVARVWTEVVAVRELPAGWPVGYEREYITQQPTRIALLGVGYRHGITPALRWAYIRGRPAPILGKAGMDSAALDVTGIPDVERGETAVLFDGTGENIDGWVLPALVSMLSQAERLWKHTPVGVGTG